MSVGNWFEILPTFQKRIHHLAHNGTRADDRDLNHDVVEAFRTIAWKRRHLCAALYLKKPNGIGLLKSFIDFMIILRKQRQIHSVAIMLRDQLDAIFEHRHHSQSKQIDFYQPKVRAIFLVPLHDDASGHAGGLERHHTAESPRANDHAGGALAKITWQMLHAQCKVEEFRDARRS